MIGEHANLGMWPAGGSDMQWWFDLPWSPDFVRPDRPIEMIRAYFTGMVRDGRRGVSQRIRAPTGGADLRPRHDVGADEVLGLGQSPRTLR